MGKLVSIVVPMYNAELYIEETINSVLKQTYTNWELIIIDDCSIDRSCKIVQKYTELDKRIKLIKQNSNGGPAKARQRGIDYANGSYIAFLDSDDIWIEYKLEKQIGYMEQTGIEVTCTSYSIYNSTLDKKYSDFIVPKEITYYTLLKQNFFSCNTVVINKDKICNIVMVEYDKHEDYLTWLNLMKIVEVAHGLEEVLAIYRLRKESRSTGKLESALKMWHIYRVREKLNIYKSLYYIINYMVRGIVKYRNALNLK